MNTLKMHSQEMKFLHTSDWHLGRSLYGRKRYDEFSKFLDWLSSTIEEEGIDALLVAGDIFDTSTPSNRAQARNQMFVAEAPVVFVCCAETDKANMTCGHSRFTVDCAIAVDHMTLAAVEEGLGTCWIGAFTQEPVRKILDIPKDIEVFALLPTGYPTDSSTVGKKRKSMDEIVCYDSWKL